MVINIWFKFSQVSKSGPSWPSCFSCLDYNLKVLQVLTCNFTYRQTSMRRSTGICTIIITLPWIYLEFFPFTDRARAGYTCVPRKTKFLLQCIFKSTFSYSSCKELIVVFCYPGLIGQHTVFYCLPVVRVWNVDGTRGCLEQRWVAELVASILDWAFHVFQGTGVCPCDTLILWYWDDKWVPGSMEKSVLTLKRRDQGNR